ncbi:unnamed protein product [Urochloa humidicola]
MTRAPVPCSASARGSRYGCCGRAGDIMPPVTTRTPVECMAHRIGRRDLFKMILRVQSGPNHGHGPMKQEWKWPYLQLTRKSINGRCK